MPRAIDIIIDDIIRAEGGYSDNPADSGGKTCWGITEAVARSNGFIGSMKTMDKDFARAIYYRLYVVKPKFDHVLLLSNPIASELVDTGVNMGTATACIMLQKALNAFNNGGKLYADLVPDGDCGQKTMDALAAFLRARHSDDGERVLLVAMNCLQGARYLDIASAKPSQEAFCYGWLKNRVSSQI